MSTRHVAIVSALGLCALGSGCTGSGSPTNDNAAIEEHLTRIDERLDALDQRIGGLSDSLQPTTAWVKAEMERSQAVDKRIAERRAEREARRAERDELRAARREQGLGGLEDEPVPSRAIEGAETAIVCEDKEPPEWTCSVDRAFVDSLVADPMVLAKQARVVPSLVDGKIDGFKLYGVRRGSLPNLLGIRNGDQLVSVNGMSLGGIDEAMATYTALRKEERLEVELVRKGISARLIVEIVE